MTDLGSENPFLSSFMHFPHVPFRNALHSRHLCCGKQCAAYGGSDGGHLSSSYSDSLVGDAIPTSASTLISI